jgi:hypothetical protein
MKKRSFIIVFFGIFAFLVTPALAQFTPQEIAERAQWEEFLLTAEIVKSELVGEGVTAPYRLYIKKGDVEKKAAWKNPSGMMGGFLEGWQYEIAAYRLDKLIGLDMVPVTVEREFKGKKGALSLWADNKYSLLKMTDLGEKFPESALKQTEDRKYIARLWDCLIANDDRTMQNVLYTDDWRTILIDHSRAFRSSKKYRDRLMFGTNGLKKSEDGRPFLIRRVPRTMLEKIQALDFASIKQAVGPYLKDDEINAIIARKKLIADEISLMIKQNGEDKVLY